MVSNVGLGLLLVVLGLPGAAFPYQVARFSEEMDAVGSKRRGPVEPTEWNVALTRYGSIVMAAIGVGLIVFI